MKTSKLAIAAWLAGVLLFGTALAQDNGGLGSLRFVTAPEPTMDRVAGEYVVAQDDVPTPSALPGKAPTEPAAPAPQNVAAGQPSGVEEEPGEEEEGFKLFKLQALERRRIDVRGWIEQGFTWNPDNPVNRFNGPVAYNDRSNEYMLNQLYLIAERTTKTEDGGWDVGGRVDLLYGTDSRFPLAFGLDKRWNQGERFYGLALPQLYGDVAYNKLLLRAGHFLAPCGYENVQAPENFFYSHGYTFLYAQPTTLTGAMLSWKLNDRLSVNGGVDAGWNAFESINDKAGAFGGLKWTSPSEKTTVALEFFFNNQQLAGENVRSHYALVVGHKVSDRLTYAFEHNYGFVDDAVPVPGGPAEDAKWYSIVNYLVYEVNPCWSAGLRYEWLRDRDGQIVVGLGPPHGIPLNGVPTDWNELAVGLSYKPNKNVTVRSELRWDWADPLVPVSDGPFDDFGKDRQFLWGTDLIVRF